MISRNKKIAFGMAVTLLACHTQVATVLPKGESKYEIVGSSSNEEDAFRKAESEARYTCDDENKQLVVLNKDSVYQGADKEKRGDVEAENVALAFITGSSGKERDADDYKVTLLIECK